MIRIEVDGSEVIGQFKAINSRIEHIAPDIYEMWEDILDGAVRPVTPVATGYMISQLRAEYKRSGNKGFNYGIKDSDCYYAKFVEHAWGGSHAFFWPAVNRVQKKLVAAAEVALKDACTLH